MFQAPSSSQFVESQKQTVLDKGLDLQEYESYARTYDNLRQALRQRQLDLQEKNHPNGKGMPSDAELAKYFEAVLIKSLDADSLSKSPRTHANHLMLECLKTKMSEYLLMVDAPFHAAFNDIMFYQSKLQEKGLEDLRQENEMKVQAIRRLQAEKEADHAKINQIKAEKSKQVAVLEEKLKKMEQDMAELQQKHAAQLKRKNNPSIDLQELQRSLEMTHSGRLASGTQSQQKVEAEMSYGLKRNDFSPRGGDYTFSKRSKSTQKSAVAVDAQ